LSKSCLPLHIRVGPNAIKSQVSTTVVSDKRLLWRQVSLRLLHGRRKEASQSSPARIRAIFRRRWVRQLSENAGKSNRLWFRPFLHACIEGLICPDGARENSDFRKTGASLPVERTSRLPRASQTASPTRMPAPRPLCLVELPSQAAARSAAKSNGKISRNVIVQFSTITEHLKQTWYQRSRGRHRQCPEASSGPQMDGRNLDGIVEGTNAILEAKFMLPWAFTEGPAAESTRRSGSTSFGCRGPARRTVRDHGRRQAV
jgi:hypothetical protein